MLGAEGNTRASVLIPAGEEGCAISYKGREQVLEYPTLLDYQDYYLP